MSESQFVTYAQNCEDVLLWRALKHVRNGFYIDVGAQDPVIDSVTKAFYDRGWRGINVEPVRHWYERLVEQRPRDINLCIAASDHEGELKLCASEDSGLSTSNETFARAARERGWSLRETQVPCTTLSNICAEYVTGPVHFLKVDCEGAEAAALRGMPIDRVRPSIILVEANEPNSSVPTHAQWESLLTGNGYEFVYSDGINRYYVATECAELRAAFALPPNALDDYVHASELRARELQREVMGLQSELGGKRVEISRLQQEYIDITEKLGRVRSNCDLLREELAHRIETARAQATEILRLQQEYRDVAGTLEVLRAQFVIKAGVASAQATEISRLQLEYREITEAREIIRTQLFDLQRTHEAICAELAAIQASHSWRLTAPLRMMRRATGKVIHSAGRGTFKALRPIARALRPTLRKLAQSRAARKAVVATLGKDAAIIRHGRLFLFGSPSAPVASNVDTSQFRGFESSTLSRRERIALAELQRAALGLSPGNRGHA